MDKGPDSDNVNIQAVTPVGNSWIVCRSKSHVGRIYYFNTLTGEAAWNLSDAEIEKATKRTTSILENQPETVFESCPEPKGPPTDNNNCVCKKGNQKVKETRIFSKQIINNKFTKPHYAITPVINTPCVTCRPLTVGMAVPTTTSFSPNIWAFPPNQQIVIASATQSVNPNQTTFTNAYNNEEQRVSVENTSVPLSRRFNSIHEPKYYNQFYQRTNEFSPRTNGNKCNQPFYKNYSPSTSIDLRQKLTARRSFQWNKSYDYQGKGHNKFQNGYVQNSMQKIQIIKPTTEDLCPIDADDKWLKEHAFVEGTQFKLNIEPLKNIAMSDVDLNCWFIVADSKALLDHCYLINIIVNSDEQCQLMIAEETMVELQSTSRSDDAQLMSRAHRVLQLLSQQITSGHAVMGKDSSTNSKSVDLVDFTIKLTEQNHNVVLVCQSIKRKNYCNEYNIPIFTIEKIKEILVNQPVNIKPKSQALPEESLIKIIIPNDITRKQSSERNFRFHTSNETSCDLDVNTEVPLKKTNTEKFKNFDIGTQEMGVQTECIPDIEPTSNKVLHVERNTDHGVNSNPNMLNNNISNIEENTEAVNAIPKRREIRLKRNIYQQSANNVNNVEKKQFKWRRRKVNSSNRTMVDSKRANVDVNDSRNYKHDQYEDITDDNLHRDSHCDETIENEISNDCNVSDTSSSCFFNRNIIESVIIEETSTSDVISNTVSNVDSESLVSTKQNFQCHNDNVNEDLGKCVMFEVENAVMEEHLETRSDEWSSRFIQIMEEVLTQILQRDTHSFHYSLPPPWTLHEATECIKRKFNDDCDIKDATNKLTNILYNISDARGNINMRLKPIDFMEMYSYGVYLVDSLQAVVNSCEDIQTASDSLAKLLADIKDPNAYSLNNDSFTDNMEDPSANDTLSSSMSCHANSIQKENNCDITSNINQTDDKLSNNKSGEENKISTKKYNLRSKKKSLKETNVEETGVKFIRNLDVESTFFSFLKLRKNVNVPILKPMSKSFENNLEPNPQAPMENENSAEPKIVRQFSKFLEFEEKIKNKVIKELDFDNFDHAEDEPEEAFDYYDDEYNSEYDYYENEDTGYEDIYEMTSVEVNEAQTDTKDNGNHDFKWIIGKIMKEVRQALKQVESFCKEVCEELNKTKILSSVRRLQIQERADNARTHLDKIYGSLNSILYREDTESEDNIKTILNKAGVFFDSGMVPEYRKTVAKSLEQVDILLESVDIVMKAVK